MKEVWVVSRLIGAKKKGRFILKVKLEEEEKCDKSKRLQRSLQNYSGRVTRTCGSVEESLVVHFHSPRREGIYELSRSP